MIVLHGARRGSRWKHRVLVPSYLRIRRRMKPYTAAEETRAFTKDVLKGRLLCASEVDILIYLDLFGALASTD